MLRHGKAVVLTCECVGTAGYGSLAIAIGGEAITAHRRHEGGCPVGVQDLFQRRWVSRLVVSLKWIKSGCPDLWSWLG